MASRYLLESSSVDGYQLEDGSGVLLLEGSDATSNFFIFFEEAFACLAFVIIVGLAFWL